MTRPAPDLAATNRRPVEGTPQRVQRKRTKGWRMPEGAIYVGRPSVYGNPFAVGASFCGPTIRTVHDMADAVALFRYWLSLDVLNHLVWDSALIAAHVRIKAALALDEIRGRDLACWCPLDEPCHADVLLEIANQPAAADRENRTMGEGNRDE